MAKQPAPPARPYEGLDDRAFWRAFIGVQARINPPARHLTARVLDHPKATGSHRHMNADQGLAMSRPLVETWQGQPTPKREDA